MYRCKTAVSCKSVTCKRHNYIYMSCNSISISILHYIYYRYIQYVPVCKCQYATNLHCERVLVHSHQPKVAYMRAASIEQRISLPVNGAGMILFGHEPMASTGVFSCRRVAVLPAARLVRSAHARCRSPLRRQRLLPPLLRAVGRFHPATARPWPAIA